MYLRYVVVVVGAAVSLFPIFVMITTSFKIRTDAFSIPPKWLFVPTLQNYIHVLFSQNFFRYFVNSIIIALLATLFSVVLGALAAYALARFRFMGKGVVIMGTLLLRMVAPVILVIPIFILWNKLGLINGRFGLVLTYVALNLSFNIWVLRTFILEIPVELEEAALIDGCGEFTIFFKIILPLIAPGLAVASIFTFRIAWNEFILSLVLTNRFTRTLPVAVSLYLTDHGIEWGQITAIATIIAVPAFIFTFTAAKSLIMGLTAGAVKG
ncbi:sugar ABC transporter permease [candidate division KSB3 bacterium]|uniref:Sugar ABC transporter permease n=1 Tax=candidate division KSB3 bacterium TaxID=2044937 RepID=A0A2G6E7V1_9BACT|nr:MAG: sugar ABC transporter permease [candidate division KSB3 bacterium]PIE30499.1 MAG: sugar ABC transporter permease [candidate division KSB3 bacterium]